MSPALRLVPFLIAVAAWAQQPYLNLDFETASRGMPWYWSTNSPGYQYDLDAADFQSGAQSLAFRVLLPAPTGLGSRFSSSPLSSLAANTCA